MSFWSATFMDNRRKQWLKSIAKFQYQVGNTWYDASLNSKTISEDEVIILVSFPRTSTGSQTITAVRIIDDTGAQAGYQAISIVRTAKQGVLGKFVFPIYEKEATS